MPKELYIRQLYFIAPGLSTYKYPMKKKLAIYGDSFAGAWPDNQLGWPNMLRNWMRSTYNEQVDIYAHGGTSFPWALSQFRNTHRDYEHHVFVITSTHRLWWPITWTHKDTREQQVTEHWHSLDQIRAVRAQSREQRILDDLEQYWTIWRSQEHWDDQIRDAIAGGVSLIKELEPTAIIIPAFDYNADPYIMGPYKGLFCLHDISQNEFGFTGWNTVLTNDFRPNHMTQESNEWVLYHIQQRLKGNFTVWEPRHTKRFSTPREMYDACNFPSGHEAQVGKQIYRTP